MNQIPVSKEVRALLDTAGLDYLRTVETISKLRERAIWRLTKDSLTNEEMHAIRGEIATINDVLAILGWSEVQEQLKRY